MAESVDIAIVGAGVAGLAAAALAARDGASVRVFEQAPSPGGAALIAGEQFSPTASLAPPVVTGIGPKGQLRRLLGHLGIADRCPVRPIQALDPAYAVRLPEHSYVASANPERFRQELSVLWPGEAPRIEAALSVLDRLGEEYGQIDAAIAGQAPLGPLLAKWHDEPLSALLDHYVKHPELRGAFTALWPYAGLPPHRLSAAHYAWLWREWHTGGVGMLEGGGRALADALRGAAEAAGAVVECGVGVRQILRRGGRVLGVMTSDGREYQAGAVISTASPHDTFEDLLAAEGQTAAGYPALRSFATSTSALQVRLRLTQAITAPAACTFIHTTHDAGEAFFDLQRDEPQFASLVCIVHGTPDSPATGAEVTLYTIHPYARYDNWHTPWDARRSDTYREITAYQELREALGDWMIERAEDQFPDLGELIEERAVTTPLSIERRLLAAGGAAYGWALLPEQSGGHRPGAETPFRGLFMAGQWTAPGAGIEGALLSAERAAHAAKA